MATAATSNPVLPRRVRKAEAIARRTAIVRHAAASGTSLSMNEAAELEELDELLGFDPELFTGDVEVIRSIAAQTVRQYDTTKEDKERHELLKLLQARADKRERERLHPTQPRYKSLPLTQENADIVTHELDERIATCNLIMRLLIDECSNAPGTATSQSKTLQSLRTEISGGIIANMRVDGTLTTLRDVQACNPRLFAGDVDDKRPAWDWQTVSEKQAEVPRGGGGQLRNRTEMEVRKAWPNDPATAAG